MPGIQDDNFPKDSGAPGRVAQTWPGFLMRERAMPITGLPRGKKTQ